MTRQRPETKIKAAAARTRVRTLGVVPVDIARGEQVHLDDTRLGPHALRTELKKR